MGSVRLLEPVQQWFVRRQLPCLVVGSCAHGVPLPSVDADYRAACRHAGALLRRKGHRRIAPFRPDGDFGGDLEEPADTLLEATQATNREPAGAAAHTRPASRALLEKAPPARRPMALCRGRTVHVLTVGLGISHAARHKRIPQDMAVISRDNEPSPPACLVPLGHLLRRQLRAVCRRVSKAALQLAETGKLPPGAPPA